jgi:hypothetical protein
MYEHTIRLLREQVELQQKATLNEFLSPIMLMSIL